MAVTRRHERLGALDRDHDDRAYRIRGLFLAEHPLGRFVKDGIVLMQGGAAEEAISAPRELLDDVDLDIRVGTEIGPRIRRCDIEKEEVIVVPDSYRPLRR